MTKRRMLLLTLIFPYIVIYDLLENYFLGYKAPKRIVVIESVVSVLRGWYIAFGKEPIDKSVEIARYRKKIEAGKN